MGESNSKPVVHQHHFESHNKQNERNTLRVVLLTVFMMVVEIAAGSFWGSMALLADGWHMGTHAAALGITYIAYIYARRYANDRRFSFGTGKVGILAGFSSAVVLLIVALLMAIESVQRLLSPHPIQYTEAIIVAILGLVVNLVSASLLKNHDHSVDHQHQGEHQHSNDHHVDHNIKAAYLHVLADALTSVLAIVALLAGNFFGLGWMDAVMGLVGAFVISRWSIGLMKETGAILLDQSADHDLVQKVKQSLEATDTQVVDLHIWKVNSNQYAGMISIISQSPKPVGYYRDLITPIDGLVHITIEVHEC